MINIYFIIINPLLVKYFCLVIPKLIVFGAFTVLLVLNYLRYIKNKRLDILSKTNPLFFNNIYITYVIIVAYFIISGYLMWIMGDITREIYLSKCR